ncbi:alpha/beta hydrolase [Novosphingobium sp.]|uniref:alpha/beta fold hydrolase n=1 Tax=Novosphingobium sp. TaxID=1874826 RepID=UPI00286B233E|nr:alpha/beta hydrolase [Novosphingobium sp.]
MHGLPGSPDELTLAGKGSAWLDPALVLAPDRNSASADTAGGITGLAQQIAGWAGAEPVTLVGFSLGGAMALRLAPLLAERVARIHLIAPAAPLSLGNFLPDMAGGALFGLARDRPRLFALLCRVQALGARFAPALLVKALLADTRGGDAELAREPAFRALLGTMLGQTFANGGAAYRAEIADYVGDWERTLDRVTQPVTIWQGDQDNWVPPPMSQALVARLPAGAQLNLLPGLSHYSSLQWYLGRISPGGSPP